jgi:hypothetical protein
VIGPEPGAITRQVPPSGTGLVASFTIRPWLDEMIS